jgi:hypothetical protein
LSGRYTASQPASFAFNAKSSLFEPVEASFIDLRKVLSELSSLKLFLFTLSIFIDILALPFKPYTIVMPLEVQLCRHSYDRVPTEEYGMQEVFKALERVGYTRYAFISITSIPASRLA